MSKTQRIEEKVTIHYEKGLHVRVAATIVQKADRLQNEYNVLYSVHREGLHNVPLTSILLVTALKVKKGEEIYLVTEGEQAEEASKEMKQFLEGDFNISPSELNQVDNLLQDNVITAENVYSNIESGLLVVDNQHTIIIYNTEAEHLFGIPAREVLGRKVTEVFPDSRLPEVVDTKEPILGYTREIGKSTIVVNTTPIIENDEIKGAISTFEDVSRLVQISWEFEEVKELKERYLQILEAVQDGICVFDREGTVTYINGSYNEITGENISEGDNIHEISPNGSRMRVLEKGQKIMGEISQKKNGKSVVANIVPIIVNQQITGGISVVKNLSEIEELIDRISHLSAKTEYLEEELHRRKKLNPAFNRIVGVSNKLYDAMKLAAKTADNNFNVLIRGESGTGKELIAEAIHYSSERATQPFIRVNCAAIPENLLESEMFGHVKGAYTGAIKTKIGKFELADKGTIFLDEIGELDKSMQAKMLRVIQKKEFQRVGDDRTITVDARIIAATNRNLEELVENGEFREDLYYRLNVIPIWLPPLRERREDIPVLSEYFLNKIAEELGCEPKKLSGEAMDALIHYSWPGNIRELENVMERINILADGREVQKEDLPHYISENYHTSVNDEVPSEAVMENGLYDAGLSLGKTSAEEIVTGNDEIMPWEYYEREIIRKALKKYGSYNAAGKALGLTHKTVAAKARKYHIEE
ncbi:MAG: HPr family phosphocarrier protein [Lachnospiraceae bacterium]